ncbi:tail fiber assembly protein [Silvimonas sp.]|uniref:tail fiber assembly protein n=1 Tax=Silvimonas sp. TaxID=2650811 RepID=UPI002842EB3E|nr:tail fiber assembly protein [Silvimonas sp.]MDR3429689.1 tail fiber assembly protein [Silvimonas sp.]
MALPKQPAATFAIWRFAADTGQLLGEDVAYLDPLAWETDGTTRYIVPPCATTVKPPAAAPAHGKGHCFDAATGKWKTVSDYSTASVWDTTTALPGTPPRFGDALPANLTLFAPPTTAAGQVVQWSGKDWALVADHRGEVWYSQESGLQVAIVAVGDIPAGLTQTARPDVTHAWDSVTGNWVVDDLLREQHQVQYAQEELARRTATASERITTLADAVALEMATDAEAAALTDWKRYRVLLSRVPKQEMYPAAIDWPALPA